MFGPAFEAFFSDKGEFAKTMTRASAINAVVGFAAISAFFSIFAFYAGFLQAQNAAQSAAAGLSRDETPAPDHVPLKARNEPHQKTCASGYGWGDHMDPANDVFCHPSFTANPEAAPRRVAAYAPPKSPHPPRAKPRRAIDNAVASTVARAAGLSRTQKTATPDALARALEPESEETKEPGAPTLPGGIGLNPLSPGFLNIGGIGEGPVGDDFSMITRPDTAPPDNSAPPGDEPPAGETPPTDAPPTTEEPPQTPEQPDMPLPPLDPVDPDPVGPIDPSDPIGPSAPVDPTVVPVPGALLLWLPGIAALTFFGKRRRRA